MMSPGGLIRTRAAVTVVGGAACLNHKEGTNE